MVLEYDVSPVGPYREYVTMGGVVGLANVNVGNDESANADTLGVGQWGTNLYVNTQVAEDVCQLVWGVPAQVADIEFVESGDALSNGPDNRNNVDGKGKQKFTLSGWGNACILNKDELSTSKKRHQQPHIYYASQKSVECIHPHNLT